MTGQRSLQVEVQDLSVEYGDNMEALHNVSLDIYAGELLGIVGESGCGKSTLGGALVGDLPGSGRFTSGSVVLHGPDGTVDMVTAGEPQRRSLWGRRVAMVYQDPNAALNPGLTIGDQVDEAVRRRPELMSSSVRDRTLDLLEQVHLPSPNQIVKRHPHQLSGGQQQRAVLAMALAASPDLLVLDEPTTGLDVTTEAHILDLILELKQKVNAGIVFITHNLAVVAQIADRVGVMYAGEFFEIGAVRDTFDHPSAPYTVGLLACIPRIDRGQNGHSHLRTIAGSVPAPNERSEGCSFAPRCPWVQERCWKDHPGLISTPEEGHRARCFFTESVRQSNWPEQPESTKADPDGDRAEPMHKGAGDPLLAGRDLTKVYGQARRRYWIAGPVVQRAVEAIKEVTFELYPGETLGVVGESGCGKSTLVNCVSGLVSATDGTVLLAGTELPNSLTKRSRPALRRIQMVFQNPHLSLNPQHTVEQIVERSIDVLGEDGSDQERRVQVVDLVERVGLGEHYLSRYPAELSGGEKQRVAVARALAGNPDVMLADEITSSLDVSVRAAILNLLGDLQRQHNVSYLFISHDMSAIRHVSNRVMVLYLGMVMEIGPVAHVFETPSHPYTEALISAIPMPDPDIEGTRIRLEGPVPSADRRPSGCPFHTRCPRRPMLPDPDICVQEEPPWRQADDGHYIYCHIPLEELEAVQSS